MRTRILLVLLAGAAFATSLSAQAPVFGPEFQVGTSTTKTFVEVR